MVESLLTLFSDPVVIREVWPLKQPTSKSMYYLPYEGNRLLVDHSNFKTIAFESQNCFHKLILII